MPRVSLAVICGPRHEAILERLYFSAQGLADELVVVAASGTAKNTIKDTAEKLGAVFGEYKNNTYNEWPHLDDFAAARNLANSLATGDFVMWADTDDVFPEGQPQKHRDAIEAWGDYSVIATRYDVPTAGYRNVPRERIFKRMPDGTFPGEWQGRVHELFAMKGGTRWLYRPDLVIQHSPEGKGVEGIAAGKERNLRILGAQTGNLASNLYYLATEYFLGNNPQASIGPNMLAQQLAGIDPSQKYHLHLMAAQMYADPAKKYEELGKAIVLSPNRREAYGLLAENKMNQGSFHEAKTLLERVNAMPFPAEPIWNLEEKWYNGLPAALIAECDKKIHEQAAK